MIPPSLAVVFSVTFSSFTDLASSSPVVDIIKQSLNNKSLLSLNCSHTFILLQFRSCQALKEDLEVVLLYSKIEGLETNLDRNVLSVKSFTVLNDVYSIHKFLSQLNISF